MGWGSTSINRWPSLDYATNHQENAHLLLMLVKGRARRECNKARSVGLHAMSFYLSGVAMSFYTNLNKNSKHLISFKCIFFTHFLLSFNQLIIREEEYVTEITNTWSHLLSSSQTVRHTTKGQFINCFLTKDCYLLKPTLSKTRRLSDSGYVK